MAATAAEPAGDQSSKRATIGALVAAPDTNTLTPTTPGACNPLVVSVTDRAHPLGSAAQTFHTFARSAVGLTPTVCTRSFRRSPGATCSPATAPEASTVSTEDALRRPTESETAPFAPRCTFPWYRPASVRRPTTPRNAPPPAASLSVDRVVVTSLSVEAPEVA